MYAFWFGIVLAVAIGRTSDEEYCTPHVSVQRILIQFYHVLYPYIKPQLETFMFIQYSIINIVSYGLYRVKPLMPVVNFINFHILSSECQGVI